MKRIFYYTDVLPFLGKEEMAIDKLIRNLEIFRNAKDDVKLVWHPWSKTEEYLKLNRSPVLNRYVEIVKKYREDGWGDFDEANTYKETLEVLLKCDGYYGDTSDMAYEAQLAKLPVMLQNFEV